MSIWLTAVQVTYPWPYHTPNDIEHNRIHIRCRGSQLSSARDSDIVLDETVGGRVGTATVTPRITAAAHPQFAGYPVWAVIDATELLLVLAAEPWREPPWLDGRATRKRGEIDREELPAPTTGKCHPDRSKTLPDDCAPRVDCVDTNSEPSGDLGTNDLGMDRC
jgi:hypothetical protein